MSTRSLPPSNNPLDFCVCSCILIIARMGSAHGTTSSLSSRNLFYTVHQISIRLSCLIRRIIAIPTIIHASLLRHFLRTEHRIRSTDMQKYPLAQVIRLSHNMNYLSSLRSTESRCSSPLSSIYNTQDRIAA